MMFLMVDFHLIFMCYIVFMRVKLSMYDVNLRKRCHVDCLMYTLMIIEYDVDSSFYTYVK